MIPGSAVRHEYAVRYVTDCATRPSLFVAVFFVFLEIVTSDTLIMLIYKFNHPDLIACSFMENSIDHSLAFHFNMTMNINYLPYIIGDNKVHLLS